MKLPIETSIPLATLNQHINEVFDFDVRTANCLYNAGIMRVWQLLVQCEGSLLKTKNLRRKSLKEIEEKLGEKGLQIGALHSGGTFWYDRVFISKWSSITTVEAVGSDRQGINFPDREAVERFLAEHGLHANMTVDELFVYVPTERPPLTEAQVAFLHQLPEDTFAEGHELTWCRAFFNGNATQIVFDIAVILPHLRDDDDYKDVITRIRSRIEAEVGPLPLALSSDELRHFFR